MRKDSRTTLLAGLAIAGGTFLVVWMLNPLVSVLPSQLMLYYRFAGTQEPRVAQALASRCCALRPETFIMLASKRLDRLSSVQVHAVAEALSRSDVAPHTWFALSHQIVQLSLSPSTLDEIVEGLPLDTKVYLASVLTPDGRVYVTRQKALDAELCGRLVSNLRTRRSADATRELGTGKVSTTVISWSGNGCDRR